MGNISSFQLCLFLTIFTTTNNSNDNNTEKKPTEKYTKPNNQKSIIWFVLALSILQNIVFILANSTYLIGKTLGAILRTTASSLLSWFVVATSRNTSLRSAVHCSSVRVWTAEAITRSIAGIAVIGTCITCIIHCVLEESWTTISSAGVLSAIHEEAGVASCTVSWVDTLKTARWTPPTNRHIALEVSRERDASGSVNPI